MKMTLADQYVQLLKTRLADLQGVDVSAIPIEGESIPVNSGGIRVIVPDDVISCLHRVLFAMSEENGLLIPAGFAGWSIQVTEEIVQCIDIVPLTSNISVFFQRNDFVAVKSDFVPQAGEDLLESIREQLASQITLRYMARRGREINSLYFGGYDDFGSATCQASVIACRINPMAITILDLDQFPDIDRGNWPGRYWVFIMCLPAD